MAITTMVSERRKQSPPITCHKNKGKAIPLQARRGPDVSRRLRFPDFKTIST